MCQLLPENKLIYFNKLLVPACFLPYILRIEFKNANNQTGLNNMTAFHITRISSNSKTGPIPVTTTSKDSCPSTCPLIGAGCYAELGHVNMHWTKVSNGDKRALTEENFLLGIKGLPRGTFWRHNQAGDLPSNKGTIDNVFLSKLVTANKQKNGFTYTHNLPTAKNIAYIDSANKKGFTINLSANNKKQAIEYYKTTGQPVVTILELGAPNIEVVDGVKIVACPAEKSDKIQCSNCKLCAVADRDYIIGFRVHGSRKDKANIIAVG